MPHCCSKMKDAVESVCDEHTDRSIVRMRWSAIPRSLMSMASSCTHGGSSIVAVEFCPWCGAKLPESKRDRWFEELQRLGFRAPLEEEVPEIFRDARWYSNAPKA